ncbi:MAG TPA: hypothetical protein PK395_19395, partial [bacterium]|nr:hypothetical protein [bacterium]HQQ00899.1 hypothetical protein [bacterium]
RPKLVVTYSMPTFGADAGPGNDYLWLTPNWTMDIRQDNMKADRLALIRYFSGSDDDDGFVETAYENGMKVIYLIGAGDKYSSGSQTTYPTAASFATHVFNELNPISDYIDGTISNTVIAVELGNEEDGEMKWSTVGQDYNGGQSFAAYYVEAREEIKQHWPQLEIISGGSLSYHKDFHGYIANPNDIGAGARAFLCGFIDKATDEALTDLQGAYDYLPDTLAIHGYIVNHYSPEDHVTTAVPEWGGPYSEWKYRMACLVESCTARGWLPNIAVTEYGYSPTSGNDWAPLSGASQTSQAVYYMRSCLLNATVCVPGINWKYSLYFHHPMDSADVGFHDSVPDVYPGADRAIRYVAREIGCATGNSPGLCAESTIWSPLETREEGDSTYSAWCGWKRSDGSLFGAIWQYQHSWNYFQATPELLDYVVDGEYDQYYANRYRFTISSGTASYQPVGTPIQGVYADGKTTWSIPQVDENPTFLLFDY